MDGLFGAEGSLIVRFIVAFVIVLGLIGATFWIIRRFGATRVGAAAQRGRQPRLAVIDAAPVDGRRRLVLVRRDNVEHLLMIGGPSDIVVEQNIVRAVPVTPPRDLPAPRAPGLSEGGPRALAAASSDEDSWAPPAEAPVARPSYARPEPIPRGRPPLERPSELQPRGFEMPPRPPLPPGLAPRPVEPRSMEPRSIEPRTLERAVEPRPLEPAAMAPPPIVPEPEPADAALANMAQRLEAALRRPGAPEGRTGSGVPAPDLTPGAPAADLPEQNGAKSRSVLDSLEEEMASLLGRPPEKQ
ncbi:MAG: flagellar biosynthetic protein FliO [Alphaproteobacteria bacterium]|nr:flagellar biosynthetic protein FliO [Alphaproteobacteria bacterium]